MFNKALDALGGVADQLASKLKGAKAKKALAPGVAPVAFNLALLEEQQGNASAARSTQHALGGSARLRRFHLAASQDSRDRGDFDLALEHKRAIRRRLIARRARSRRLGVAQGQALTS